MALATVVGIRGSTYRREGARYLVPERSRPVGTISGGCLEGEVREVAAEVMAEGRSRLLHFDLTADDEVVWGWGLGCNGAIDVFVEPGERAAEVAGAMRRAVDQQRRLAVVTVVDAGGSDPPPVTGARILLEEDGDVSGSLGHPSLDGRALEEARRALEAERSRLVTLAGDMLAFVEVLIPPTRLVVCGAGHDAIPLVRFAAGLGWRVEVVDDREPFLSPSRFPQASRFVRAEPGEAAKAAGVDERSYVVVMSHNFLRDRDYLRSLLGSAAAYIGMLGPRGRLDRLLEELKREGIEPSQGDLSRVHGPAGLDIGAEGPEEIAWAIVGEILAVRNSRGGGFLRERAGSIHDLREAGEAAPAPAS
jgi:xanthine dehydrogenase accessory factor